MSESLDRSIQVPELTAEEIQARVLHRDGLMLVIDKPAGLPVHRGPKGGANLETSFEALRFGLPRPPVLAHRLDRDTSGCLVLGRHRKATASLGLLFKHGRIGKTYWAVVEGGPAEDEGTIDMPLRRAAPASAFPRDRDSDFEEQGTGPHRGTRAGAHARTAQDVWLERRVVGRLQRLIPTTGTNSTKLAVSNMPGSDRQSDARKSRALFISASDMPVARVQWGVQLPV